MSVHVLRKIHVLESSEQFEGMIRLSREGWLMELMMTDLEVLQKREGEGEPSLVSSENPKMSYLWHFPLKYHFLEREAEVCFLVSLEAFHLHC